MYFFSLVLFLHLISNTCCRDEDDGEFLQTKEILDELGVNNATIEDCRNVRKICKAVSERAAYLAAAGSWIQVAAAIAAAAAAATYVFFNTLLEHFTLILHWKYSTLYQFRKREPLGVVATSFFTQNAHFSLKVVQSSWDIFSIFQGPGKSPKAGLVLEIFRIWCKRSLKVLEFQDSQ